MAGKKNAKMPRRTKEVQPHTFTEVNRAASRSIAEQARELGVFKHPTGKGDGREDLIRDAIAVRLGTSFGIAKAEILDSKGGRSKEFDGVVFDHGVAASLVATKNGRRVLRAEAAAVTVEVKSRLDEKELANAERASTAAGAMHRCMAKAPLALLINKLNRRDDTSTTIHLRADETEGVFVPRLANALFAYDSRLSSAALQKALDRNPALDAICILGHITVARSDAVIRPRAQAPWEMWGLMDDAFGAFMAWLEDILETVRVSRSMSVPWSRHYYLTGTLPELKTMRDEHAAREATKKTPPTTG